MVLTLSVLLIRKMKLASLVPGRIQHVFYSTCILKLLSRWNQMLEHLNMHTNIFYFCQISLLFLSIFLTKTNPIYDTLPALFLLHRIPTTQGLLFCWKQPQNNWKFIKIKIKRRRILDRSTVETWFPKKLFKQEKQIPKRDISSCVILCDLVFVKLCYLIRSRTCSYLTITN